MYGDQLVVGFSVYVTCGKVKITAWQFSRQQNIVLQKSNKCKQNSLQSDVSKKGKEKHINT